MTQSNCENLQRLQLLPSMGWLNSPSPVTEHSTLADALKLGWFGSKRDDQITALGGGNKVRKLNLVLASQPAKAAKRWRTIGAIASGQALALAKASRHLQRPFEAMLFWVPPSDKALAQLAFIASHAEAIHYQHSATQLYLRHPGRCLGLGDKDTYTLPLGATSPLGMIGFVLAAFELREQIAQGLLPPPDRIVLPLGTGGTAIGLTMGLALAGIPCQVHAVSAVERWASPRVRLHQLGRQLHQHLNTLGVTFGESNNSLSALFLDRSQVGAGYSIPTPASEDACDRLCSEGLSLERNYTGKAMAAVLAGNIPHGEKVLFWVTNYGETDLTCRPDWREALPGALKRRLAQPDSAQPSRRTFILGALAASVGLGALRLSGYTGFTDWRGAFLSAREAIIVTAAAAAMLKPWASDEAIARIPERLDNFLVNLTTRTQREIHLLLLAVEQSTTLFEGLPWRMSRLTIEDRDAWLRSLAEAGGVQGEIYQGIRALVMMAYYQQEESWPALGYEGPLVKAHPVGERDPYLALLAPVDQRPDSKVGAPKREAP